MHPIACTVMRATATLTVRDLRSFEILLEFESAVPFRFDSTVMGRFENFRIGRFARSSQTTQTINGA